MKTIQALNALAALNNIAASKRLLPSKFAYASAINRKRLAEVAEAFEEGRKTLLDRFGEKDKAGKLIEKEGQVTLADPKGFHEEYVKLGDIEAEVKLHKVPLESFPEEIALPDMDALMVMVLEPEAA